MPTSHAEWPREEGAEGVAHAFDLAELDGVGGVQMLLQNRHGAVDGGQQKLVARQNRAGLRCGGEKFNTEGLRERVKNELGVS